MITTTTMVILTNLITKYIVVHDSTLSPSLRPPPSHSHRHHHHHQHNHHQVHHCHQNSPLLQCPLQAYRTMLGCCSCLRRDISRIAVEGMPSSSASSRIFFSAIISFVTRSFACCITYQCVSRAKTQKSKTQYLCWHMRSTSQKKDF